MPDYVKELDISALRTLWKNTKKKAAEDAKTAKAEDKYKALDKLFGEHLGPDLDKWSKNYPDLPKLTSAKETITKTIDNYTTLVGNSGLPSGVTSPLKETLVKMKTQLGEKLNKAKEYLATDEKATIAESKKFAKKKLKPLIIFDQDFAGPVKAKGGDGFKVLNIDELKIQVILSDPNIIEHVPHDLDDDELAGDIREAASFSTLCGDIATAVNKAAKLVKKGQADLPAAKAEFEKGVNAAIEASLNRSIEPILKLVKVKGNARSYKINLGIKLTLTTVGLVAGIIGLALTPLTFGASTVLGAIGVAKAAVTLGDELGKASLSAEQMGGLVASDLKTLNDQYKEAKEKSVGVGLAEMGKTLVTATLPIILTTIKSCNDHCTQLKGKIDVLDVKSHEMSQKLGALLTEQTKLQGAMNKFFELGRDALDSKELAAFQKLDKSIDESAKAVSGLLEKIPLMRTRVKNVNKTHSLLSVGVAAISAKEPTWAKVGEVIINIAAAAGFAVGGNVGAPDPYQFVKVVADVNQQIGNVVGALDAAKTGIEDLHGILEKKAKG